MPNRMSEKQTTCTRCGGRGQIPCPACGGTGRTQLIEEGYGKEVRIVSCASCHGSGNRTCGVCGGLGKR